VSPPRVAWRRLCRGGGSVWACRRGVFVGLRRLSTGREEEGGGGGDRLLSTEALSLLSPSPSLSSLSLLSLSPLSLFRTSDASSPLFVVVSLVSLSLRKLKGFDRVFGCVVWAMQRFRTRLRGELDTSHPETLVWLREGAAVLHGLSAPPESSSGLRRLSRTGEEEGDGGGDDDWRLWPPPQHRGCLSLLSLSSLSLLSLSLSHL
jgi:hypothetical protein